MDKIDTGRFIIYSPWDVRRKKVNRKPAAHKKMMKKFPHKDPPEGTKAYKKHEKTETKAVEKMEHKGRKRG